MKKAMLFFVLAIVFVNTRSYSQTTDSTKHIVNTWKFTQESLQPVADYRLEQMKKQNPAMADQIDVKMIMDGMKQTVYTYNADGTYEISSPQGKDAGTWKLSDDKKSLVTKSNTSGRETTRLIVKISEKGFSLKLSDTLIVNYEPAK